MKIKTIAGTVFMAALFVSLPTQAAQVSKSHIVGNAAEASFSTFSGCEDAIVGVSVKENNVKAGPGGPELVSEVAVFGSFVDICPFGSATSFSGTVPLNPGEYSQDGANGATLIKTFTVDGFEISLSLRWTGEGEIISNRSHVKEEDGATRIHGHESISSRSATLTGIFLVNGLDRISGNTVINGSLGTIRSNTETQLEKH